MRVRFASLAGLGAAATLFVSGCQGSGAYAQMAENIQNISEKQDQILDKLGQLESKIGQGGGAAPADAKARPRPGRPDPSATYKVPVGEAHTKGPEDAKVTIVEWSDFQCPFCSRVNPTLAQVREEYPEKVKIVFRQFPLSIHPNAWKAAEASLCAHEQGEFWAMHDAMFADQRNLGVDSLKTMAEELGLDTEEFATCLDSDEYSDAVQADFDAGREAGVSGTPAMFINGRFISGAVPFEQIASVIDSELSRMKAEGEKASAGGEAGAGE